MAVDFLLKIFAENKSKDALVWNGNTFNYQWMIDRFHEWLAKITASGVQPGSVVVLEGDYSPNAIAAFLALIQTGCMVVPLTDFARNQKEEWIEVAQGEYSLVFSDSDEVKLLKHPNVADHELYGILRKENHPGLVLFSSGSTGKSKAIVHDLAKLLKKFQVRRKNFRTLTFLLFDHIGGIDTLFYSLSNGSCIITVKDRSPQAVCQAIEQRQVEVLPVSPTFLNLLILSEEYRNYDLSSLKYITYGAEVMPEATLKRCAEIFPNVILLQKFGITEIGTLRSKSENSQSLWVKIGGEGYQTRVVNGILQIKAESAMIGYLNAPNPFTEDGWFDTGDAVEVKGEYLKILGRKSEMINVGGEKVYPAEVEGVIQEMENVADVTVYGEKNPLIGNMVCAKVRLLNEEDRTAFTIRLKNHCRSRLQPYKVPVKVVITNESQHSERFKKKRNYTI